jgi:glycosyltransferase involved in cell wall biosynthesis
MAPLLVVNARRSLFNLRKRRRDAFVGLLVLLFMILALFLLLAGNAIHSVADLSTAHDALVFRKEQSNIYAEADVLDIYPPRPGESFISFHRYLRCLDKRLNVDHRTRTERPFTNVNATMPYLVLPVTVEQGDMKALMCNMSVQVRHIMYVQNGGVGSMTAFLDRVQEAFAFTSRLKLPRLPHNYGYSVALNVAMRDALSMPFDEVPFLMMANNDVRIPGGMLEDGLPQMYAHSLAGRARVAELEAEVATEPNEYTPERFREVPLRSTDGRHVLVTSRLLPDRIRYQTKEQRRTAFADYYGALYIDHNDQTAFWGLTRLAMEVTGYFDENCYPAYYEDVDYLRRSKLLGFKSYFGERRVPGLVHLGNGATLGVARRLHAERSRDDALPFIRAASAVIKELFHLQYAAEKYATTLREVALTRNEPFLREGLPLDVYVLNVRRRRALNTLLRGGVNFFTERPEGRALHERLDLLLFVPPDQRESVRADLSYPFNASVEYSAGVSLLVAGPLV